MAKQASIVIDGKTIRFEVGHTKKEWENLYLDECWDVSVEDLVEGALEPNEDYLYWFIEGRLFETDILND